MPHLVERMRRLTKKDTSARKRAEKEKTPDFEAISKEHPLPDNLPMLPAPARPPAAAAAIGPPVGIPGPRGGMDAYLARLSGDGAAAAAAAIGPPAVGMPGPRGGMDAYLARLSDNGAVNSYLSSLSDAEIAFLARRQLFRNEMMGMPSNERFGASVSRFAGTANAFSLDGGGGLSDHSATISNPESGDGNGDTKPAAVPPGDFHDVGDQSSAQDEAPYATSRRRHQMP